MHAEFLNNVEIFVFYAHDTDAVHGGLEHIALAFPRVSPYTALLSV